MSALVVNYNGGEDLLGCLRSLERQAGLHEIIVVDNGSHDGSLEDARRDHPDVHFIARHTNDGFAGAANAGAVRATGELLLFLNPDVVLDLGCVAALSTALRNSPGVVGPVLWVEATGRLEYGATVDVLGMPRGLSEPSLPLYVPGCALATNAHVFRELGGFDARYFLFVEDTEYCWRALLAGYEVAVSQDATAWHRGGGSTPGGYARGSEITTTKLRVSLRERNGMALFIACAPAKWIGPLVTAHLVKTAAVAVAVGTLLGRPSLSWSLLQGLWWNARQLPATLHRRRSVRRRKPAEREAFGRLALRSSMLHSIRQFGLPRFVDDPTRNGACQ